MNVIEGTIADLIPDQKNANAGTEEGGQLLEESLRQFGAGRSILADKNGNIIAGNKTLGQASALGMDDVIIVESDGSKLVVVKRTDIDINSRVGRELAIADNKVGQVNLKWDEDVLQDLASEFDIDLNKWGFDALAQTEEGGEGSGEKEDKSGALNDRFIVPPFTVLDARQGYWQERKNAWLSTGIKSVAGRSDALTYAESSRPPAFYELRNKMREAAGGVDPSWDEVNAEAAKRGMISDGIGGTSIFDPVLCELAYRWWNVPGGVILDPFAGGSVRGLVAAMLGYPYVGVDLRPEQVEENQQQAGELAHKLKEAPVWRTGNSLQIDRIAEDVNADFIFSCPPYFDLEVYSDDPDDLSTMKPDEFARQYKEIIKKAVSRLKNNRFGCFVVGDVRNKKGFYLDFLGLTIDAFQEAGAYYYNEAILVTQIASAAIRANQFTKGRKLCKTHQNVLVFYKGDPKAIRDNFPEIDATFPEDLKTDETGI